MKTAFLGTIVIAGLVVCTTARASDTVRLGGVGSTTAPIMTLKGDSTTPADNVDVNGPIARTVRGAAIVTGRVAVGSVRVAAGYPFYRPWYGYGFARPWYGWYRPWYGYGFARPWYGWYRPGVYVNIGLGGYPVVASAAPVVTYAPPVVGYGATTVVPGPQPAETGPPPRSNEGFRYDGGPRNPVPAPTPKATTPPVPVTPPVTPPGTVDTVARRPIKKLEYPAYGESPVKPRAPRDPLVVKSQ